MDMRGPPGQRFHLKLKGLLRDQLGTWNKEVFGDIERRKLECLEEIQKWDRKEEEVGLSEVGKECLQGCLYGF